MSRETLDTLEAKVGVLVEEHRRLRDAHAALREASERDRAHGERARQQSDRALRDLRSVLGSAVRILREE